MARLEIEYRKPKWMPALPHTLLINGQHVGVMSLPRVEVELPKGIYQVKVVSMFKFISSERSVAVDDGVRNILTFCDKEKLWDLLFWVALVAEVVHLFITLEPLWEVVYHVVDEGLFLAWIIREWCIRKRYFAMHFEQLPQKIG